MRRLGPAAALVLAALACGGGEPAAGDSAAATDSADRFAADTQYLQDSLGNQLMIVSERTRHLLPREVEPRADAGDAAAPDAWRVLEPHEAQAGMRDAHPPWYLLDVRDSEAWVSRGRLAGAALVPLELLEANVDDLHVRTDQIVLIYADDEVRARAAAGILAGYGFPHLRVLGGGLEAWSRAGLPLEGR